MIRDVRAVAVAVKPDPVEPDVTLTMSADVARTLLDLANFVAGMIPITYRRDINEIALALSRAGVRPVPDRFSGSIGAQDVR